MTGRPGIVDFHAHVGCGAHKSLAPDELLKQMDGQGVERSVICPIEEHIAVRNREGNDLVAEAVRLRPDRFTGLAVANPWYGAEAVAELERALDLGLKGLKLNPVLQGFMPCDSIVFPLVEVVQRQRLPVYVHTGSMNNALPFQLLHLAQQFPSTVFIMGHMGFSDFWYDVIPVLKRGANIYVETSHAGPANISSVLAQFAGRMLFGSDVPESNLQVEIEKFDLLDLDCAQIELIFRNNALQLLGGRP